VNLVTGASSTLLLMNNFSIMAGHTYMTKGGYEKLKAELDDLKTVKRQEIAAAIAEAREKGDLSENAEYKAAKDEQGMLEMKISQLDTKLAMVRLLDESQIDSSKVSLLTTVRLKNLKNDKELKYTIVPESESDIAAKRISSNSPVGEGLLGKKVGDIAEVKTPRGVIEFEILEITI